MDDPSKPETAKQPDVDKAKKPVKKKGADAPKQIFEARTSILHDGEPYEAGDPIEVTRETYDQLKAVKAISGDWKED